MKAFPFQPAIGPWSVHLSRVVSALARGEQRAGIEDALEDVLQALQSSPREATARYSFALSVLADVIHAGGRAHIRDSRLWVAWPRWEDPSGRSSLQSALMRLRPIRAETWEPSVAPSDALRILESASISLEVVDRPDGGLGETFRRGISTWSMPYRGREGRMRRIIVVAELGGRKHPVGLIEAGDDAPHSPARDQLAGFQIEPTPERPGATFGDWVTASGSPSATCDQIADRLAALRSLLGPVQGFEPTAPLRILEASLPEIRSAGEGRAGEISEMHERKRMSYLARLVAGEVALRSRQLTTSGARDAVRVLRDLTMPRIHLEITICGALPPFNQVLGGKLIAGLIGHSHIRSLADRPVGEITRSLFGPGIERLLPSHGACFLTTKGLYARHSAQYNRVVLPPISSPIPLKKIGDTVGTTTSLISDRTAKLAEFVLSQENSKAVSRAYGSGGGKRQRTIEAAAKLSGLHEGIVHARISRPVYAASLVSNLREVALLNAEPKWRLSPDVDPGQYEAEALSLWRSRWAKVAKRRGEFDRAVPVLS